MSVKRGAGRHGGTRARGLGPLLSIILSGVAYAEVSSNHPRRGLERSLEYLAPWPPWVTILLVLAAAILATRLYLREPSDAPIWTRLGLAAIRVSLVGLVIWMMYGFTVRPFRTDLPDLLLLLDNSQSMSTRDGQGNDRLSVALEERIRELQLGEATRLNQAKAVLLGDEGRLARFLQSHYQLKLATLQSADLRSGVDDLATLQEILRGLSADVPRSHLGRALRRALQRQRGRPVAAVVMFTDGITTEGVPLSEIAAEAKEREIPLHLVGTGSHEPMRDLHLSDLLTDDVVFLGDLITFDLKLNSIGFDNETVQVLLKRADGLERVGQEQVELSKARESQSVRLAYRPEQEGTEAFVIEVEPREGEAKIDNNSLECRVQVRDEKTRVLLVQSYPSYEFHYLKTLLGRPRAETGGAPRQPVELHVVLQDADPEYAEIDDTAIAHFPTREELFQYDVCIFLDVNPSLLGEATLTNLRDFVRDRGHGLIGIAGPRYFPGAYADTPLRDLIPFDIRSTFAPPAGMPLEQGFRPWLTPLGQRFPSMQLALEPDVNQKLWSQLPELYWLLEIDSLKPGVRVLAEHPTRTDTSGRPLPVTMLAYVGAGNVLFHATDDSWRWRIGRGDELFGRYWLQWIRYLSRFKLGEGREIELASDRETYRRGDVVQLRARFFDDRRAPADDQGVLVILEHPARGQRQISLPRDATERGVFSTELPNLATGHYHAWIAHPATTRGAPSADFEVTASDTEMTRLAMDAAELREAARISGGEFYTIETAEKLMDKLPVGRQVRIESLPPVPVWNAWQVALLFTTLLATEWLLRRRLGMV